MRWGRAMTAARMARAALGDRDRTATVPGFGLSDQQLVSRGQAHPLEQLGGHRLCVSLLIFGMECAN